MNKKSVSSSTTQQPRGYPLKNEFGTSSRQKFTKPYVKNSIKAVKSNPQLIPQAKSKLNNLYHLQANQQLPSSLTLNERPSNQIS